MKIGIRAPARARSQVRKVGHTRGLMASFHGNLDRPL
jgi:hypothetical protein